MYFNSFRLQCYHYCDKNCKVKLQTQQKKTICADLIVIRTNGKGNIWYKSSQAFNFKTVLNLTETQTLFNWHDMTNDENVVFIY